ncbi:unnamed protein product [Microthlaspi erraticum]|uniref:TFIIS N-terminal domain-containing protein n=1 Tax=Microthlaspi erraticum TaxID=1685480 RepID=A0A6D2KN02_9BRAS|nr:unnamed protein product [Microthlaspi erraticum]
MRVRIAKERSDLTELVSAVIKTTYDTRSPGGVERCIDALNQLRHRNPKIRKEAQSLFGYWYNTLYARGRDDTSKAGLTKSCQKPKKSVLRRCSELKKKEERKSVKDERSQTHEAVEIKKEDKTGFLDFKKEQDRKFLTHETEEIKKETYTNLVKSEKKEDQKMLSVTPKALPQHWRQNIKDKDGKITTKSLRPPSRRDAACKNVARKQTGPFEDSGNPKSPALKIKTEEELTKRKTELVELFEAAMKASKMANSYGKPEVSRCVEALSLLMNLNISPSPKEPRRMMERLEGLTKHKYHNICNAASSLLHHWRQIIRKQERKDSAAKKTFPNHSCKAR